MWQDYVMMACSALFLGGLVDALRSDRRVPVRMAAMTGTGLLGLAIAQATLGLWGTAMMSLVMGLLWLALIRRDGR